jgi:glycosyltransferase involved in cell wall biosynthesis
MRLTLSIAVYNKPENLRLVLLSCARQTMRKFEVVIADDGSGPAIARVVEEARVRHGLAIRHLWHEDRGWRKNVMLNNVIREAGTDYLVFIDGDCILHRRFLEDHLAEAEEERVLCGRRVEMGKRWAALLSEEFVRSGRYEHLGIAAIRDSMRGDAQRVEDGIRLGAGLARRLHSGPARILGSNFSIHRRHLEAINGFDESYTGPGCGEDSDIEYRLGLIGVTPKGLRHRGIQYHIHHPLTTIAPLCRDRFDEVRERGVYWCENGLEKA